MGAVYVQLGMAVVHLRDTHQLRGKQFSPDVENIFSLMQMLEHYVAFRTLFARPRLPHVQPTKLGQDGRSGVVDADVGSQGNRSALMPSRRDKQRPDTDGQLDDHFAATADPIAHRHLVPTTTRPTAIRGTRRLFSRVCAHLPDFRNGVKGGRRRGPADTAPLRPVNPQMRTRSGAPANFRLCATDQKRTGPQPPFVSSSSKADMLTAT